MVTSATVFGLDVSADVQLPLLQHAPAAPTGRDFAISVAAGQSAEVLEWPDSAELVCDQRAPDGTVNFCIEAHPQAGYLIWGPTWGSHLIGIDGRRAVCATGDCVEDAWQRLMIAQLLPFAAVMHGLEVFHAGAVASGGSAIALIGPSRAGKTSVALELCRRGASFLTDDVLAVERIEEELLCHPGAPVAGLDHAEAQRLARRGDAPQAEVVAINARERLVRVRSCAEPVPLVALFLLDRRRDAPNEPRFEPATDPQLLLSATFNSVLTAPARLRGLLDICALAARRRVERIVAGPEVDATQLAVAIEQRLGVAP